MYIHEYGGKRRVYSLCTPMSSPIRSDDFVCFFFVSPHCVIAIQTRDRVIGEIRVYMGSTENIDSILLYCMRKCVIIHN